MGRRTNYFSAQEIYHICYNNFLDEKLKFTDVKKNGKKHVPEEKNISLDFVIREYFSL
jgi:hypothetical protein